MLIILNLINALKVSIQSSVMRFSVQVTIQVKILHTSSSYQKTELSAPQATVMSIPTLVNVKIEVFKVLEAFIHQIKVSKLTLTLTEI